MRTPLHARRKGLGVNGRNLQNIYVPETIASQIVENLRNSQNQIDDSVNQQKQNLSQRITTVRNRIDQLYIDKLDGKIEEDFWTRKSTEWQEEHRQLKSALLNLGSGSSKEIALTAERTFELANRLILCILASLPRNKPNCSKWCF